MWLTESVKFRLGVDNLILSIVLSFAKVTIELELSFDIIGLKLTVGSSGLVKSEVIAKEVDIENLVWIPLSVSKLSELSRASKAFVCDKFGVHAFELEL